jgi:hypothetical protein
MGILILLKENYGRLAQLGEPLTYIQVVGGSNPSAPIKLLGYNNLNLWVL